VAGKRKREAKKETKPPAPGVRASARLKGEKAPAVKDEKPAGEKKPRAKKPKVEGAAKAAPKPKKSKSPKGKGKGKGKKADAAPMAGDATAAKPAEAPKS